MKIANQIFRPTDGRSLLVGPTFFGPQNVGPQNVGPQNVGPQNVGPFAKCKSVFFGPTFCEPRLEILRAATRRSVFRLK